jgi:membrane associated rhomboid family serine protease
MYEYERPRGFSMLPVIVKNLLIINGLCFLALLTPQVEIWAQRWLPLYYVELPQFFPTQFVTYMFMHGSFGHILFNMFSLWMFGSVLENFWGQKKLLTYYMICGIGAALVHTVYTWIMINFFPDAQIAGVIVGASGAIYGLLVAYGYLFPENRIYIYFFIPLKAKWFVILLIAFDLFGGFTNSPNDNVAHFAHLGGALAGFITLKFWKKRRNNFF